MQLVRLNGMHFYLVTLYLEGLAFWRRLNRDMV